MKQGRLISDRFLKISTAESSELTLVASSSDRGWTMLKLLMTTALVEGGLGRVKNYSRCDLDL